MSLAPDPAVPLETPAAASSLDPGPGGRGAAVLRFLVPSLLGLALFVVPVPDGEGSVSVPVALLAGRLEDALAAALPAVGLAIMAVSALGALAVTALRPDLSARPLARALFQVGPLWTAVRVAGLLLGAAVLLEIGPEGLWGEATGQVVIGLVTLLITVFLVAGFLLPLLLDFGLLEFAGTLLRRVMRPLFRVPGRSSVSSLAAWLGDGSIGVLMTAHQYERGHYTQREAAVLATTFNVVSITFTLVIVGMLGLGHVFGAFYLTIVVAGFVAALIMPRIPPLSRIPDEPRPGVELRPEEGDPGADQRDGHLLRRAWDGALERARTVRLADVGRTSAANVLEMWLGVLPVIMAIGLAAILVAEHTPLFAWLGAPFVPVLEWLGLPEADVAAQTLFIGFADMLLPAILAADVQSELTRFVVGALSVTQLIYLSEVGGMLMASSIPVRFGQLVAIFLLRTAITLPVIVALAHLLV